MEMFETTGDRYGESALVPEQVSAVLSRGGWEETVRLGLGSFFWKYASRNQSSETGNEIFCAVSSFQELIDDFPTLLDHNYATIVRNQLI